MKRRALLLAILILSPFLSQINACTRPVDLSKADAALVDDDPVTALEIYLAAALSGDVEGADRLGMLYLRMAEGSHGLRPGALAPEATPASYQQAALRWFQVAAAKNYAPAQFHLGEMTEKGVQIFPDLAAAYRLYESAALGGMTDAQLKLAIDRIDGVKDGDKEILPQDETKARQELERLAFVKIAAARFHLAILLRDGKGGEKDAKRAEDLLTQAADTGFEAAGLELAMMYRDGLGVPKDLAAALKRFQKRADDGDSAALYEAGLIYEAGGTGVVRDDAMAADYFKRAAEQGHADAQFRLALKQALGEGVKQDLEAASAWLAKAGDAKFAGTLSTEHQEQLKALNEFLKTQFKSPAAEETLPITADDFKTNLAQAELGGDAELIYKVGLAYENGIGTNTDRSKAIEWFEKAVLKGHAGAMVEMGDRYRRGRGVKEDDKKALELFRKAAEKGDATAQNKLGVMYDFGRGVEKNPAEALKWYLKAAEQGHAGGQYNAAHMLLRGDGVTKDVAQALAWYEKAATQEHVKAILKLAELYAEGEEVIKDEARALEWTRKAAELSDSEAQKKLSEIYIKGIGTKVDRIAAVQWALKAGQASFTPSSITPSIIKLKIPRSAITVALSDKPKLISDVRAVPYFNDGKQQGFKLLSVKIGSLFEMAGLKRGDVWKSVNGEVLDIKNVLTLSNDLKDETQFTLELERRGTSVTVEIEITS